MTRINHDRTLGPRKIAFTQQSWAADVSTATTDTVDFAGKVVQIEVVINETTQNITFTIALTTANSGTLYSQAAIADDQTKVYFSESNKGSPDADFNPFWNDGVLTATFTPSNVPGASGVTVTLILYVE